MNPKGLFVGMTTVDVQYLVGGFPRANSKTNARRFQLATGGPATNAAAAFSFLGGQSRLCSTIGEHAFSAFMREELQGLGIELLDLAPASRALPPISSIITTEGSGQRAVIAYAGETGAAPPAVDLADSDVLLLDGFQLPLSRLLAAAARQKGVPVVLDGGSWKTGLETLLPLIDVAICSADFRPPGSPPDLTPTAVLDYLAASGAGRAAITRGEKAVLFRDGATYGKIPIAPVPVVDTLGAGDVFHGAFCYYFARDKDFTAALRAAAVVAGKSVGCFGAREWGGDN